MVVSERYIQQRLIPSAIETRAVGVAARAAWRRLPCTLKPVPRREGHTLRDVRVPDTKLRVVAPDVGGGFGSKLNVYSEEVAGARAGA